MTIVRNHFVRHGLQRGLQNYKMLSLILMLCTVQGFRIKPPATTCAFKLFWFSNFHVDITDNVPPPPVVYYIILTAVQPPHSFAARRFRSYTCINGVGRGGGWRGYGDGTNTLDGFFFLFFNFQSIDLYSRDYIPFVIFSVSRFNRKGSVYWHCQLCFHIDENGFREYVTLRTLASGIRIHIIYFTFRNFFGFTKSYYRYSRVRIFCYLFAELSVFLYESYRVSSVFSPFNM